MKIGVIGFGHIGKTLASKLSAVGHDVRVANSRGPDSIAVEVLGVGGHAVTVAEAVAGVDAVILSLPLSGILDVAPLISAAPAETVVIDTSNYYPFRDGAIAELDDGQPEAVWVSERIGRPIIKAWNAVLAETLSHAGKPEGEAGRIAIPVAGDDAKGKVLVFGLVNATGFDPVDAGALADSWRQQPGNPAYCTELTSDDLVTALGNADKARAPAKRDQIIQAFIDGVGPGSREEAVAQNRRVTAPS
jgi:predicted dinucleotide-binding enzyme